jgi:nicotinamidase-related amidase
MTWDPKELRPRTTALLLIDMQNDFVSWTFNAMAIIPCLKKLLDVCRASRVLVVHVVRHYREDGSDVELPRIENFLEKPFVVAGTPGAEIVAELRPWEGEPVIIKKRWSAFFKTGLLVLLEEKGIDTIIVGGIFTPNCVRTTVFDAVAHDLNVVVLNDGTASVDMDIQDANILDMINIGVKVSGCDDIAKLIDIVTKV